MATKPTSFLSLPRELRQDILHRYLSEDMPRIDEPPRRTKKSSPFIHSLPRHPIIPRIVFVRIATIFFDTVKGLVEALPEVVEDVEWVADIIKAKLTRCASESDFLKDGRSLEAMLKAAKRDEAQFMLARRFESAPFEAPTPTVLLRSSSVFVFLVLPSQF
ncbi:hypothetical protein BLS_004162 [Venturia inaequalis]|uniref:Uncharacterized protein n=1 Tax=Venturia inaequalis TaxID=5025 RepID=A0A8H3YSN7_VENIN|nr:hypothetical protein BLS_004162 [Venturia inaequalis]